MCVRVAFLCILSALAMGVQRAYCITDLPTLYQQESHASQHTLLPALSAGQLVEVVRMLLLLLALL